MDMAATQPEFRIGASEVAPALGLSPYCTPLQWWTERTGRADRFAGNEATVLGQYLEASIGRLFADGHRVGIVPGEDVRHPSLRWMAATPDFLVEESAMSAAFKAAHDVEPDEVILLEVKTTGLASFKPTAILDAEWGADGSAVVPVGYALQVQQQIAVVDAQLRACGLGHCRRGIVKALIPGRGCPEFVIDADPELQLWIREGLTAARERYLIGDEPPPPSSESDWRLSEDLRVRTFKGKRAVRTASPAEVELLLKYRDARDAKVAAATEAARLRAAIVDVIGDDYALTGPGMRVSYSNGRESAQLHKGKALDEIVAWARASAPVEVRDSIETVLARHTHGRRTSRRFTARFDDRADDTDTDEVTE